MPSHIVGVMIIAALGAAVWVFVSQRRSRAVGLRRHVDLGGPVGSDGREFIPTAPATARAAGAQRRPRRGEALRRSEEPDFVAADAVFDEAVGARSGAGLLVSAIAPSTRVPIIRNAPVARVSPQWIDIDHATDQIAVAPAAARQ